MLIGPQNSTVLLNQVRYRIRTAALAAGRDPATVGLIAVTKTQPAEIVLAAATAGVTDFGENYLQEALPKMRLVKMPGLRWHFIGGIQTNKTRAIAENFDWVHSVDRLSVARRLAEARRHYAEPLNVCLQVALTPEATKGGVASNQLGDLAAATAALPHLKLRGLMCVPPPESDPAAARAVFGRLRMLKDELNEHGFGLDTLSMGMSADFEAAIAEGATLVRIGTALFGKR